MIQELIVLALVVLSFLFLLRRFFPQENKEACPGCGGCENIAPAGAGPGKGKKIRGRSFLSVLFWIFAGFKSGKVKQ
jgi:hypothetical protein